MKKTNEKNALTIRHTALKVLIALLCIGLLVGAVGAATTTLEVTRATGDGGTVIATATVTLDQMKADFPIQGDGKTHYGHQGPVFEEAYKNANSGSAYDMYDQTETVNVDDAGALRGTAVKDLAALVGGIPDDAKVTLISSDGFQRDFTGSYINNPSPKMGTMVIVWEVDGVDAAAANAPKDLMRNYFFSDDHVFGDYDMHQTMPQDEYWYNNQYPSSRGVSVQNIAKILIQSDAAASAPKAALTTFDRAVTIDNNNVVIPAAKISSNTPADTTVMGTSLAGIVYKTFPNDVEFWAGGQNGARFNLNSLLGMDHKVDIGGTKYFWDVYVDGVKQDPTHWGTDAALQFTNGQSVSLVYESEDGADVRFVVRMKVQSDKAYIYDNKVTLDKTGTFKVTIDGNAYDVAWNSPAGILKALDFDAVYKINKKGAMNIVSFVDRQTGITYDDGSKYVNAYNADDLSAAIAADAVLAPGSVIYIQYGGDKGKLEGSDALIKAELNGGGAKASWPLVLSGVIDIPVDKAYFEESAAPSHSRVEYTDKEGNVWNGVPLRVLAGMVDEVESVGTSHYTFSTERAAKGYPVILTAGDGKTAKFNANALPGTKTASGYSDAYILADTLNGQTTALTFTGSAVAEKLTDVRNIRFDVSAFETKKDKWEIALEGRITGTLNDVDTYAVVGQTFAPPTHNVEYTDANGDKYVGVGMSALIGWVDDEHPHGLNAETLSGGVTINFVKADGTSYTIDSDYIKDTIKSSPNKVFVAVYKNDEKINPTVVGSGVESPVAGITKITFTDYRNPPDVEGITVIKYAADGSVAAQKYYTWQQLRDTFKVIGDGTTVYSIQGPVMGEDNLKKYGDWDKKESFPQSTADQKFKVMNAVKGTSVKDLADSVGGMSAGDSFKLTACDGFSKTFKDGYRYVYTPDKRMGAMFLAWSDNGVDGPSGYKDMMRLFFTAENGADERIFSLWDMHESMAEEDWGWYSGTYPSTAELSIYKVNKLEIFSSESASQGQQGGYTITDGTVKIPASSIEGSDEPITVGGNTLAAAVYTVYPTVELFYKVGDSATYFNLNSYDGHIHKSPKTDKWFAYVNNGEVTENQWSDVTLQDGDAVKLVFDAQSEGKQYTYEFKAAKKQASSNPSGDKSTAGTSSAKKMLGLFDRETGFKTFFNPMAGDSHRPLNWSDKLNNPDTRRLNSDSPAKDDKGGKQNTDTPKVTGTLVKISSAAVTIPAASISGSDEDVTVPGDSLLGVLAQVSGVEFFKGGNQGAYFNLNAYDGFTHKKNGSWKTFINDAEVDAKDWSGVTVYDNQVIHLEFTEESGAVHDYYFTTSGGAAAGWSLKIANGNSVKILSKADFEALADKYKKYPCTDEQGTWNGVPLYVLAGYVDDDDETTFNADLANIGYSIRVSDSGKPTPYSINFDSKNIVDNNVIIVANTLNGADVPETTPNGKPSYPLQMKGVAAGAGQSIGNIGSIELVDVPDPNKFLLLSGKMEYYLTKEQFDSSSHHFKTINGVTGMPLYLLVAIVDDIQASIPGKYDSATGHFSLNNDLIAKNGYTVVLTSANGQTYEIPCSELAGGSTVGGNYIIAKNADETLTLAGNKVTSPFNNVKSIKLVGPAITGDGWSILVSGPDFGIYYTQTEFEEAAASSYHAKSFTDPVKNEKWSGVNLATLVGFVDDFDLPMPGESHAGAFNNLLAQTGYKIIVTSSDGYSAEIDSKALVADKDGYIIANKVNGAALTDKNVPLKIAGSKVYDTANEKFTNQAVGGIAKIELKEFAKQAESPTIKITKLDSSGNTVKEVNLKWSDIWSDPAAYPVIGDGKTLYGFQGLATVEGEKHGQGVAWDLEEKELEGNWKVSNAVKGTAVSKLTDLVGGMDQNDEINFICSKDGWTTTLNYANIYTPTARQGTAFLVWYADGQYIPDYKDGARLFFTSDDNVLSQADMFYSFDEAYWHYNSGKASAAGLSAQKVDTIKIVPKEDTWSITLKGAVTQTIDKNYFEDGLSCTFTHGGASDHQAYYTDAQGHKWGGMPLFLLAGFVDDENSHQGKSFNTDLAQAGYKITVVGSDGSKAVVDSRDAFMSTDYIVANTVDGKLLTKENGWPLKLVGKGVSAGNQVNGITAVELDLAQVAATELKYDKEVAVTTDAVQVAGYDVAGNTVIGVIVKSGLEPVIGTKKWDAAGILLFDGLTGYENVKNGPSWKITCNDVEINGYNDETKPVAVNIYEVHAGDVIKGQLLANDGVNAAQEFTITCR